MNKRILSLLPALLFLFSIHAQVFTDSNLPIVIITTDNGVLIPDDPDVLGHMKIIDRGPGLRNYVTDQDSVQFLNYNGRIEIEKRGSSSQEFPKKPYGFTTLMPDNVTNNNVSLLNMPAENDWILDALSADPTLIRNFLAYNLSRQIGQYASRTVYCEVILNGEYNGLYILEEKIKPDKNRVDIIKIETGDNAQPELSGGYITKSDKTTGNDPVAWSMSSYIGFNDNQFIHHWPKPENITSQQFSYIKSVFQNLQIACTADNASLSTGYPSRIDIPSFVDFILINELSSNADAYTFSTFYHKDRNGKLRAGPVWDLNLTFGNDLFIWGFDRSKANVWQFANGSLEGPKYIRDLFNDDQFKCYLSRRWNELKLNGQPFNLARLNIFIDSTVALISEAVVREEARWGTIGNHQDSIASLKTWLNARIPWMTNHLGSDNACENITTPPLVISRINYHPETSDNFPDEDKLEFLEITNAGKSNINLTGFYFSGTGLVYQFPVGSSLDAGASITLASDSLTFNLKYGKASFGQFTRNLSNSNQNLTLSDAFGNEIDHVHYDDDLPWPDADGNGLHLQLISSTLDNSLPESWIAAEDNVVSTDFVANNPIIHVYPNPTNGLVQIHAEASISNIDITDLQGRTLLTYTVNEKDFSFDIAQLPTGLYFMKFIIEKNIWVEKIFKGE
jgi:hypothetical protein